MRVNLSFENCFWVVLVVDFLAIALSLVLTKIQITCVYPINGCCFVCGTDRACYKSWLIGFASGKFIGYLSSNFCRMKVDFIHFVLCVVIFLSDSSSAKCVGFHNVCSSFEILGVNRFDDIRRLRELSQPTRSPWNPERFMRPEPEILEAQRLTNESVSALFTAADLTPRQRKSLISFQSAREGREGLEKLAELLPQEDELQQWEEFQAGDNMFGSNLKQQMQGALTVMQSGLGSSADLSLFILNSISSIATGRFSSALNIPLRNFSSLNGSLLPSRLTMRGMTNSADSNVVKRSWHSAHSRRRRI